MNDFLSLLSISSIILSILTVVGGFFALRLGYTSSADAIQKRLLDAFKTENEMLTTRVERCEEETDNLRHIIETIQESLKKRGIIVVIDGDLVTITDAQGSHSMRRKPAPRARKAAP